MPRVKRTAERQSGAAKKTKQKRTQSRQAAPPWSLLPTSAAQQGDAATLAAMHNAARSPLAKAPQHALPPGQKQEPLPDDELLPPPRSLEHPKEKQHQRAGKISHVSIAQFIAAQQLVHIPQPETLQHQQLHQHRLHQHQQQQYHHHQQLQMQMMRQRERHIQLQIARMQQRHHQTQNSRHHHVPHRDSYAAAGRCSGSLASDRSSHNGGAGVQGQLAQVKEDHTAPQRQLPAVTLAEATGYDNRASMPRPPDDVLRSSCTVALRGLPHAGANSVIDLAAVQHLAERRQAQSLLDPTIGAATLGAAAQARAEAASNHAVAQANAIESARRQQEALAAQRKAAGQAQPGGTEAAFPQPSSHLPSTAARPHGRIDSAVVSDPAPTSGAVDSSAATGNSIKPARMGKTNRAAKQPSPTAFRKPASAPQPVRPLARTPILQQPFTLGGRIGGPSLVMTPKELKLAAAANRAAKHQGEQPQFEFLKLPNPYTSKLWPVQRHDISDKLEVEKAAAEASVATPPNSSTSRSQQNSLRHPQQMAARLHADHKGDNARVLPSVESATLQADVRRKPILLYDLEAWQSEGLKVDETTVGTPAPAAVALTPSQARKAAR